MAGRSKDVLDVREMVHRMRVGERDRRIARDLGLSRNTVSKYREWAKRKGLLEPGTSLPGPERVAELLEEERKAATTLVGPASKVEPYRDFVVALRKQGVEMKALHRLLQERGFDGSYSSVHRFVRRLEPVVPEVFLRIETAPGEEAQVDFGSVGEQYDPELERKRKAWVFVMTLSHSRHQFAEIVFDQRVETFIELHVRAFEFFGGVVKRVVIDNLKAGILRAALHDPEVQRSYREFAEAYGFLIAPCRPRKANHKGKVESGVHYVQRNALAGRTFRDIHEANAHLARWVIETAGVRIHGTTQEKPLELFELEKPSLRPLPPTRYEVTVWKKVKLHRDCHVVFEYAYYSAPYRLVGQSLWLKATRERIELYHEWERVGTHPRASRRGQRRTLIDHLPPGKVEGLLPRREELLGEASKIGEATFEVIDRLLGDRPLDRLRTAKSLLGLKRRFGAKRLEAACRRALQFNEVRYHTVKMILRNGMDMIGNEEGSALIGPVPKTAIFARSAAELSPANLN